GIVSPRVPEVLAGGKERHGAQRPAQAVAGAVVDHDDGLIAVRAPPESGDAAKRVVRTAVVEHDGKDARGPTAHHAALRAALLRPGVTRPSPRRPTERKLSARPARQPDGV